MFAPIGAVLGGAPAKPAPEPVRRHSRLRGRCEGTFWRPTSRAETARVLLAAERYDRAGRGPGRRNGPLGHVALEVLAYMANLVRHSTGRLEPSIDTMIARLKRSRDAIARALKALRVHGFLDRLRRYEETGQEGRGPQLRQVSNAYRMLLPPRAARMLGRWGKAPPLPDDVVQEREERAAELRAHRDELPLDELAWFEVESGPLVQALAQLGRGLQERESAKRSESQSKRLS